MAKVHEQRDLLVSKLTLSRLSNSDPALQKIDQRVFGSPVEAVTSALPKRDLVEKHE